MPVVSGKNIAPGDTISAQKVQWVDGRCEVVWLDAVVIRASEKSICAIRSDNIEVAFLLTSPRWRVPEN